MHIWEIGENFRSALKESIVNKGMIHSRDMLEKTQNKSAEAGVSYKPYTIKNNVIFVVKT